mgnify:FL=1
MATWGLLFIEMRYFTEKPKNYTTMFGETYRCNHPIYNTCTLYKIQYKGVSIIQQRYDPRTKHTYWTEIDPWLRDMLYLTPGFKDFFNEYASEPMDGLYPTVNVRQVMWRLRMKPLKRERWETVFDRKTL